MQWNKVAALALACALGACQSTPGKSVDKAESYDPLEEQLKATIEEYDGKHDGKYVPTEVFKERWKEVQLALAEKLWSKCVGKTTKSATESCMRERMLVGFDHAGLADRHCPQNLDLDATYKCVVVGSAGYDLAARVGQDTADSFDWLHAEEATNQVGVKLALTQLRSCLSDGSASDPTECVMAGMTKALGLEAVDVRDCLKIPDDFQVGQCVSEAFGYKYMSAGIARM